MTDTIKELEQDIAQTRARLGSTINRLQGNLSPSDVADDFIGSGRPDLGGIINPVMATIRRHPAPVLLIAVGVGWLVYKMVRGEAQPALRTEDPGRGIQTRQ
jgi:Protein of unknown function (DUF3618)